MPPNLPAPVSLIESSPALAPPPMRPRRRGLWGSLNHAVEGMLHTVVHQRNMKIHLVAAIMVGLVGSGITLDLAEKVTLIFCVLMVFFAEILNTALEALVDLHTDEFHEMARVTKDVAAAGVLVLALGTMVIFAAILVSNWQLIANSGPRIFRQAVAGVPFTVLASLLVAEWRRPVAVDLLITIAGFSLLALMSTWTSSMVFTVLTAGLFAVGTAAAVRRRHPRTPA